MAPSQADFDLARFIDAQASTYSAALAEVQRGQKSSHWMWFIFPQFAGLGASAMSQRYAIGSRAEAEAYLAHPVLGPRLIEIAEAALSVEGHSAHDIFGSPDDMKLCSCATLFAAAADEGSVFHRLLDHFFEGQRDGRTLQLLAGEGGR